MRNKIIIAVAIVVVGVIGAVILMANNKSAAPVTTEPAMKTDTKMDMVTATPSASASPSAAVKGMESSTSAGAKVVKEFTVEGSNFKFVPATLTVSKGDSVKITFKNAGGIHDFVIDELAVKTPKIQTGSEAVVEFLADKAGQFEYYCSVGDHRAMGMKGTLIVK